MTVCPRSSSRFSGRITAPPPRAMTPCAAAGESRTARMARYSRSRKPSSPSEAKISGIVIRARRRISASVSVTCTPSAWARSRAWVVLPAPGNPTRTRGSWSSRRAMVGTRFQVMIVSPSPSSWPSAPVSRSPADSPLGSPVCPLGYTGQVGLKVAPGLGNRVTTGLVQEKIGQDQGGHGLGDHRSRDDGAHVGALVEPGGRLARGQVDGTQSPRHRRDRFEGGSHPQLGAVGDAALDAAGSVRTPGDLTIAR